MAGGFRPIRKNEEKKKKKKKEKKKKEKKKKNGATRLGRCDNKTKTNKDKDKQKEKRESRKERGNADTNHKTVDPKHLVTEKEIGRGAFGVVFRGKYLGTDAAIKVLSKEHHERMAIEGSILQEMEVLRCVFLPHSMQKTNKKKKKKKKGG